MLCFINIIFFLILQLVINQGLPSNKKKFIQIIVILYLIFRGRPMTNFENMSFFFELLKVKHFPNKHLCYNVG
jgi:hypothetical protein